MRREPPQPVALLKGNSDASAVASFDDEAAARRRFRGAEDHTDEARTVNGLLAQVGRRAGSRSLGVLIASTLVGTAAALALPAVLGGTLDAVVAGTELSRWLTWLVLLVVVMSLGEAFEDMASGTATARSTAWLRKTAVSHVLSLGWRTAHRYQPGDLVARLVGNTAEAGSAAADVIRGIAALLPAVGGTVALALIDPWLCLTFVLGAPLLLALLWAFASTASELADGYLAVQGVIAGRLAHAVAGARTIAAAGTVDRETKRVLTPLSSLHDYGMRMWRAQTRITAQDLLLLSGLEIAVLAVAGLEVSRGRISPGELLAASEYVALAAGLSSAIPAVTRLIRSRAAAQRVGAVLDLPVVEYGTDVLPARGGTLEFRQVTVRVAGRTVLDGLDLVIPAGSMVAIVGRSGAGKSTLAEVAGRLLDPDAGVVLLDGVPLPDLTRAELRRAIGYGFERPIPLGATVGEAIDFGVERAGPREVAEAAQAARAESFILHLPDGYATPLAQAPMSGGEIQRVGLARAFAHQGRLLILDDVAASLDTVTEHEISQALTGAMGNRTRIIIAHRASTAARADRVIWLDRGMVRAQAAHAELWADPDYRGLFEAEPAQDDPAPVLAAVGDRSVAGP